MSAKHGKIFPIMFTNTLDILTSVLLVYVFVFPYIWIFKVPIMSNIIGVDLYTGI